VILPDWLGRGGVLAVPLAIGFVVADPPPAQAQGASNAPSVEDVQREIEQLRRRVEILEGQAAATAAEAAPPVAPEPAPPEAAPPVEEERAAGEAAQAEIGAIEATEEEVERALERALVQTGVLLLPAGTAEIVPNFTYVRQEAAVPVFLPEDGEQLVAADEVRSDGLETSLTLRLGLPLDSQVQVDVPYRYQSQSIVTRVGLDAPREESRTRSGFGDVGVSFTNALLREREGSWQPNLFGSVRWDTDTGETDDGIPLGSGFDEISGSLTASKRQDPLVFVGGVGYSTSFEKGGVDPGDVIGFSIGTHLAVSPETSLRFFLNQSFVDELEVDGRDIPGSDLVVGTFVIGASSILTARVLLDVTAGIGLTEDSPDYFVGVSLPVQFDLPFRF
jgi:Putative MetA-pathway of phenol degradation